ALDCSDLASVGAVSYIPEPISANEAALRRECVKLKKCSRKSRSTWPHGSFYPFAVAVVY
ncbi:hypothetical protein D918_02945, partial [Trichuris suis]